MLLSIANASPRNIESTRTQELIPSSIQNNAKNLIDLLNQYYDYLNEIGMPSNEIASIQNVKDIDNVQLKYIDRIKELICKNVPVSNVLSPIELYKIIVRYYNARGSEESIHSAFNVFYNNDIEIKYPKENLFNLSNGVGSWSGDSLIRNSSELIQIRNLTDETKIIVGGITYDAIADNGNGQLISIEILDVVDDQYHNAVEYDAGLITISPGNKSHIRIISDDLFDGTTTYVIPSDLYFSGFGIDNKPTYSERIDNVTPWVGNPSKIEWDGTRWRFYIGTADGDLFAFYSLNDVADPCEVVTWLHGWLLLGDPIAGNISSMSFVNPINAQIFDALLSNSVISDNLIISADTLSDDWLADVTTNDREYLTNIDLLIDVLPGSLAIVNGQNGAYAHPYTFGISAELNGNIVWKQHITDKWIYEEEKSFPSDKFKLFDGYYWQDYSYEIRSDLDSSVWYDSYLKFIHPAGLKMFSAIDIEMHVLNQWNDFMSYESNDLETDDLWMKSFIPPHIINNKSSGFHTPKYQPGYLRDLLSKYIFKYIIDESARELIHLSVLKIKSASTQYNTNFMLIGNQYSVSEKFIDPCEIGAGRLSKVIGGSDELVNIRFTNISSFITYNP